MKTVTVTVQDRETLLLARFVQVIRGVTRFGWVGNQSMARVLAYVARREGCVNELLKEFGR